MKKVLWYMGFSLLSLAGNITRKDWSSWSQFFILQFSSVAQSCLTLCDPMDCSMPGLPVHHQLLESTQTHVHWVSDAIQPSHPLSSPSPPSFILSQHQGLFQWVSSLHQVARVLEFQLQIQSFHCKTIALTRQTLLANYWLYFWICYLGW